MINVDGGASTQNGSVVIAGVASSSGMTITTSGGDDQFAYERYDGVYNITGQGGQKTIDFGPSVGGKDVFFNIVGNDLYIGLRDASNPNLTADQVSDHIKIVGGALQSIVNGVPTLNNPYFLQVGGTTVDVSKLDLAWVLNLTNGANATISNQTFSVAGQRHGNRHRRQ